MEEKQFQIFVSELAMEQIKKQLAKREAPNSYLRLGVRGSGCSGFSYVLKYEDAKPKEKDLIFNINDIQVIVDKKSILYLNECTLDWEKSLMKTGFKFINPNETSVCGCGNSFNLLQK